MSLLSLIFAASVAASPVSSCPATPYGIPQMNDQESMINICHSGYFTDYSTKYKIPEVVGFNIQKKNVINCNARQGKFHQDPEADGQDVSPTEYNHSGYDRGHMADAEDFAYNRTLQYESFSMTNMTPQAPGLNRGGWKWLETASRYWAYEYGSVVVYDGVVMKGSTDYIDQVLVPSSLWKVVYIPSINRAIAVVVPNEKISGKDILNYMTTVSNIEEMANVSIPLPSSYNKGTSEDKDFWSIKSEDLTSIKSNYCQLPQR